MSRRNWGCSKPLHSLVQTASRACVSVGLAVIFLASCTPNATPFPVPTNTPPGANASPVATKAPTSIPDMPSPTPAVDEPLLPSEIALDASLFTRIRDDLAQEIGLPASDIRLAQVEAGEWSLEALGCSDVPSEVVSKGTIVRLLAGQSLYTYRISGDEMQLCEGRERAHGQLLMKVDPVALEMVLLAQQHVAQMLDLSTRRIQLVDVLPYTWPDTSLGCPLPDQIYEAREINGYRVIVVAGEEQYAFHTDSERLVPCEAGREVLPEA
jgi:hypothetical protein